MEVQCCDLQRHFLSNSSVTEYRLDFNNESPYAAASGHVNDILALGYKLLDEMVTRPSAGHHFTQFDQMSVLCNPTPGPHQPQ